MLGLSLTYNEFVTMVGMSTLPHILLEGSSDEVLFRRMSEKTSRRSGVNAPLAITTAEQLRSTLCAHGNREKVERVSGLINSKSFRDRYVGFVDREFRQFTFAGFIQDHMRRHYNRGRLVWSRGHSIENYLFDFDVVSGPLADSSPNQSVAVSALKILRHDFTGILSIACALGLTAHEQNMVSPVRGTVDWRNLELSQSKFHWDTEKWSDSLNQYTSLDSNASKTLVDRFGRHLISINDADEDDIRWLCDGHIGLKLIWNAFARAVYEVSSSNTSVKPHRDKHVARLLSINESARFNIVARNWASLKGDDANASPVLCFRLIGIK